MTSLTLVTHLHGRIDVETARSWKRGLHAAVRATPTAGARRLLVDQRYYEPADLAVHRFVRLVVPDLLATYGLYPALADAVGASSLAVNQAPDRQIVACAMVHHEDFKMTELNRLFGRADQMFFSDFERARRWLDDHGRPVSHPPPSDPCCTEPLEAAPVRPRATTHVMKENRNS